MEYEHFVGGLIGSVVGFIVGYLVFKLKPMHGGSVSNFAVACEGIGRARVNCTVRADPDCKIIRLQWAVYEDPAATPGTVPPGSAGSGVSTVGSQAGSGGTTETFSFQVPVATSSADKVAVWPVFEVFGGVRADPVGPCGP